MANVICDSIYEPAFAPLLYLRGLSNSSRVAEIYSIGVPSQRSNYKVLRMFKQHWTRLAYEQEKLNG